MEQCLLFEELEETVPIAEKETGPSVEEIQAKLAHKILHGLKVQWEEEIGVLSHRMREKLKPPLFRLAELKRQWGSWHPDKNEITISLRLATEYPWSCVRDVLRHEMAHQVADILFGGDQTPHGQKFQDACFMLRADPRISADYEPLNHRFFKDNEAHNDKILLRVQKLFALAQSKNHHEAELAMAKAHRLIEKFNISPSAQQKAETYYTICLGAPALRHTACDYRIANLLAAYYYVQPIWIQMYMVDRERMGTVLEVSGRAHNVKVAAYVYDFIYRYIEQEWHTFNHLRRYKARQRIDFALGIVKGFVEKLETEEHRTGKSTITKEQKALIRQEDQKLQDYFHYMYPRVRSVKRGARQIDEHVLDAGKERGRKMVISKGIEHNGSGKKKLFLG